MGKTYEPTGLSLLAEATGDFETQFAVTVGADEGIVQGNTSFDGNTRIQQWDITTGSGGDIGCTSSPYVRAEGETAVRVEVYKDGGKVGQDTTDYPE